MSKDRPFFNIIPYARELRTTGDIDIPEYQISNEPGKITREEWVEVAKDLKRERFALAAIITSRVVDRAFDGPFNGIKGMEDMPYPHDNIPSFMKLSLQNSTVDELRSLDAISKDHESEDPMKPLFIRFREVMALSTYYKVGPSTSEEMEIFSGIETGVSVMALTSEAIQSLLYSDVNTITNEQFEHVKIVARNSYPFLQSMASMHGGDFELMRAKYLKRNPISRHEFFDKSNVELTNATGGDLVLDFKPNKRPQVDPSFAPNTERLRCPALVSFDSKPAPIKRLWELYVNLI